MKNWLNGSKDKIPRSNVSFVDVRDTALAHLKAIQVPEAAGQRFILCGHDAWQEEVAKALGAKFPQLKIPKELADGENPDPGFGVDNTRSQQVLGIKYTPLADTMCDMAQSMLDRKIYVPEQ